MQILSFYLSSVLDGPLQMPPYLYATCTRDPYQSSTEAHSGTPDCYCNMLSIHTHTRLNRCCTNTSLGVFFFSLPFCFSSFLFMPRQSYIYRDTNTGIWSAATPSGLTITWHDYLSTRHRADIVRNNVPMLLGITFNWPHVVISIIACFVMQQTPVIIPTYYLNATIILDTWHAVSYGQPGMVNYLWALTCSAF